MIKLLVSNKSRYKKIKSDWSVPNILGFSHTVTILELL